MTDPVDAAADLGVDMVAVTEVFGDDRRVAWLRTAPSHTALAEIDVRLGGDATWSAADGAVERHRMSTGRTVTLWRRSV